MYDIFISYRRVGGRQYARILQLALEQRGYRVFLDYNELKDSIFSEKIKAAIIEAPVFIMVLSCGYLERCKNENDWVREEILTAIANKKHFVPINPDNTFDGIPENIPDEIKKVISDYHHSELSFGQTLGITLDFIVKNRIRPFVKRRYRFYKRMTALLLLLLAAIAAAGIYLHTKNLEENERLELMSKTSLDREHDIVWNNEATTEQLKAVNRILENMKRVDGGKYMMGAAPCADGTYDNDVCTDFEIPQIEQNVETFWINKYEVSIGEWHAIMGGEYDKAVADFPMTNISFDDCIRFTEKLWEITSLDFALPTEAEWEYAARGGLKSDNTKFAGHNNPDEVAWYCKNSGGRAHERNDKHGGLRWNSLDLYDMSGNVSEWCDTDFRRYIDISTNNPEPYIIDAQSKVVRGGNYDSEPYGITVYHRNPKNSSTRDATLGMRIIIR